MFLPNKSIPNSHMNDFFFKYVSITVHIGSHLRLFSLMAILDVFCHTHNIQYVICRKSGSAVRDKACKIMKLITRILVHLKETNQIQKAITRAMEFNHLKQILTYMITINGETGSIAQNLHTHFLYYHNEIELGDTSWHCCVFIWKIFLVSMINVMIVKMCMSLACHEGVTQ